MPPATAEVQWPCTPCERDECHLRPAEPPSAEQVGAGGEQRDVDGAGALGRWFRGASDEEAQVERRDDGRQRCRPEDHGQWLGQYSDLAGVVADVDEIKGDSWSATTRAYSSPTTGITMKIKRPDGP